MMHPNSSPSKQQGNQFERNRESQQVSSFLSRYFKSKQFVFPEFDQGNVNSKIWSLAKLANNFLKETLDFKSWILNCYPMSSYFKNIILDDKSIKILNPSFTSSKSHERQQLSIYIGQTHSNMKHGYGFEIVVWRQALEDQDGRRGVQFEAFEGFYANNIKHGKGKYFSNCANSSRPNFYNGKFLNGQSYELNTAFMAWANHDFYIGRVKPFFSKEGLGALFIASKNQPCNHLTPLQICIKKDPYFYEKVIISDWQQNTTKSQSLQNASKSQSLQNSSGSFHKLLPQTKIIHHSQYYFGEAYVYYSSKKNTHICIKEGTGCLKYLSGDIYQGSFTFDKMSGYGKYLWANQNYYIGEFIDGLKEGTGFWKDSSTHDEYQGEYHNNRRNGKGQYRWANGNIYNGEFKNELRQGFGKMIWATGQIYEGHWKDGLQNGIGSLYLLNANNHTFVRQSEFVNGIQMQKGQDPHPLLDILDSKRQSNLASKHKKSSHLSSSRRKSLPFQTQLRKYPNSSSLPKIHQRTATKFRKDSQSHFRTQPNEIVEQSMPKRVHRLASIIQNKNKERSLDYTETQKLPYNRSINKVNSKTQKIDRNRISSFFSASKSKDKKKRTFCVDISVEDDSTKNIEFKQGKQQAGEQNSIVNGYKKLNDILVDSLMIPIKWRNIKRKSHNFILQRKEKMHSNDEQFS